MLNQSNKTAVVIYEDRTNYEIGVKFLVLSLKKNFSEADIHVFAPNATENLQSWVKAHQVSLHLESPSKAKGWNAKPEVLLWALEQGYAQAIWMDSDLIVSKSLPKVLLKPLDDTLVASELPALDRKGVHERTTAWDLQPGQNFRLPPSSCCTRVTQTHIPFLLHWKQMLQTPEYLHWQARPFNERPLHAYGDDSVFMALLGSKNYEHLSVVLLKCGRDIAQCLTPNSYSLGQRVKSFIFGIPPIIHAMGHKPWLAMDLAQVYQSVSPYACVARQYQQEFEEKEVRWLELSKNWVGFWHNFVQGNPALSSLPFALKTWFSDLVAYSSLFKVFRTISIR